MCNKCSRAFVRAKLRRVMVSVLLIIFFSLMVTDILSSDTPKGEVCIFELTPNPQAVRM